MGARIRKEESGIISQTIPRLSFGFKQQKLYHLPKGRFPSSAEAHGASQAHLALLNDDIPSACAHAVMCQLARGEQNYERVMESEQKCISTSPHPPLTRAQK